MVLERIIRSGDHGYPELWFKQRVAIKRLVDVLAFKMGIVDRGEGLPCFYDVTIDHEPNCTYLRIEGPNQHLNGVHDKWIKSVKDVGYLLDAEIERLDTVTVLCSKNLY